MSLRVEGQFYRRGSTACQTVSVGFVDGRFDLRCLSSNVNIESVTHSTYTSSDKLGNTPREVTFDNGDVLSLPSTEVVDQWLGGTSGNILGSLEKSMRMTLMAIVLVPLSIFAIYRYAIPQIAIHFADIVPYSVTHTASQQTLAAFDQTILDPSQLPELQQQQFVERWENTIGQLSLTNARFNIQFRASKTIGANAFALPDGTIVFTDDMVKLVDENEQLLLAILLHEIGHVENKHSMRLIAQSVASAIVINYVFGDFSSVTDLVSGSATTLIQNNFSQELEWEADNFALEQLDKLGLPRDTFAKAMEKLAEEVGEQSELATLMSTHPLIKERIENAKSMNVRQ